MDVLSTLGAVVIFGLYSLAYFKGFNIYTCYHIDQGNTHLWLLSHIMEGV